MSDTSTDKPTTPDTGDRDPATEQGDAVEAGRSLRGVRDMWQVPAMLLGVVLLAAGLFTWTKAAPAPDFDGAYRQVEALIADERYEEASTLLRDVVWKDYLQRPQATSADMARFYLLEADRAFLQQRSQSVSVESTNQQILEYYRKGQSLLASPLSDRRKSFIAETYIALDRFDRADETIQSLSEDAESARRRLTRALIEAQLAHADGAAGEELLVRLAEYRDDPEISLEDRLWAVAKLAQQRLASGYPEQAIRGLYPEIHRLPSRDVPAAGELFELLGRAYVELGQLEEADAQLRQAERLAPDGSDLQGRIQISLGRVAQGRGEFEEARDRFAEVINEFAGTSLALPALLGAAEVNADLGDVEESLEAYARLIDLLNQGVELPAVTRDVVAASLSQRHRERFLHDDDQNALRYALLIKPLYSDEDMPADATLMIAVTHRRMAEKLLEQVERRPDGSLDFDSIDPVTLEDARANYRDAAEAYRAHARQTLVADPELSAQSLWDAADCFDKAGEQQLAIQAFTEFMQTRHEDPRQVEATFRLARAHQAAGRYETAIELFRRIISDNPGSREAYRSYVPLAQCHILRSGEDGAEQAEKRLLQVLDGTYFSPDAPEFRTALIELGKLYRMVGRHTEAIERLAEARERYADLNERTDFLFQLADAHRLSAADIDRQLQGAIPRTTRNQLEEIRTKRLENALSLYQEVRDRIEMKDPRRRNALEQVMLRNAMFYRGDCAYDLGRYSEAIEYYDAAAQRYPEDPSSLVAMVQIVNAYANQGKWPEARTANERARSRLDELPDDIWQRDDLPMRREHWERWLEARTLLEKQANAQG